MSADRFGKLERARAPSERTAATPAEGRFEDAPRAKDAPLRSPRAESRGEAVSEPVSAPLSDEAFQRLPTLLCGACQTENTKFAQTCHACGHALDSPQSVALNLARLAPLQEALRTEQARAVPSRPGPEQARSAHRPQGALDTVGPWPPPMWAKWLLAVNVALALHLLAPTAVAWLGTVAAGGAAFAWARRGG